MVTSIGQRDNLDRLIGADEDNEVTHEKPSKSQGVEEPLQVPREVQDTVTAPRPKEVQIEKEEKTDT